MASLRDSKLRFGLALLVTFIALELIARVASSTMAAPLRFYDAETEVKASQIEAIDDVDVLVLGSSMPWQGFLPESFIGDGLAVYNASLAGGVPSITERWIEDQDLIAELNPETVIWGLSSLDFAPSYGEQNFELYEESLEAAPGLLNDIERFTAKHLALVSHRSQLRDPSFLFGAGDAGLAANRRVAQESVFAFGDRSEYEVNTSPELAGVQRSRLTDFEIDQGDSAIVESVVTDLLDRGIRVVLVEMPVPSRFLGLHPDGSESYDLASEEISRLGSVTGAEVIDASNWFDDTAFVDFTHLDRASAEVLSGIVSSYLSSGELEAPAQSTTDRSVEAPPSAVPLSGCSEQLVEDEYGVLTPVLVCPEGETPDAADLEGEDRLVVTDANARVVAGSDGWLFLPRSVDQVCRSEGTRNQWTAEVELARQILDSVGKELVVSIVPDRGIVAAEFLGEIDNSCQVTNHQLILEMAETHPSIISLAPALDSSDLARQRDTHWTSPGALAGSRLLVDALDPNAWQQDRIVGTDTYTRLGDLAGFAGQTEEDTLEFPVVDLSGSQLETTRTDGWILRTTTTPTGSDREILLIHDSNGGNGSLEEEVPTGAYYTTPWFSRASSVRALGGELSTLWDGPVSDSFDDADAVAFMFVQRNITAWLSTGRLSVNVIGALANDEVLGDRFEESATLPAQNGEGVLVIDAVSSPEEFEITATTGSIGHRVDGSQSVAVYVQTDSELEFSEPVSGTFVPLAPYRQN